MSWRVWVGRPMVSLKTMLAADCAFRRRNSFEQHFRSGALSFFCYPTQFYPLFRFSNICSFPVVVLPNVSNFIVSASRSPLGRCPGFVKLVSFSRILQYLGLTFSYYYCCGPMPLELKRYVL